jgi:hypothetical protein
MRKSIVMVVTTLALGACGQAEDSDTGAIEQALDATAMAEYETGIVAVAVEGYDYVIMSAEEAAENAADNAEEQFDVPECVSTQVDGDTVVYTFNDCSGPYGLVHLNGSAEVTFTSTMTSARVIASGDLQINGVEMDIDCDALYEIVGADVSRLTISSSSSAVGPRGNSVGHNGDFTATFDAEAECIAIDGEISTSANSFMWSFSAQGYERCMGACPTTGGTVGFQGGISGLAVTIEFDGSDRARWSTSTGRSGTILLLCSP